MDLWIPVKDGDGRALGLFQRHYSYGTRRRKIRRFMPPCEHMVLLTREQNAVFAWTAEQYRKDGQTGICCSIFRNEGAHLSSDLILEAEDWARQKWGDTRMFTFVDGSAVASANPGYCFKMAGWHNAGTTAKGLVILAK